MQSLNITRSGGRHRDQNEVEINNGESQIRLVGMDLSTAVQVKKVLQNNRIRESVIRWSPSDANINEPEIRLVGIDSPTADKLKKIIRATGLQESLIVVRGV